MRTFTLAVSVAMLAITMLLSPISTSYAEESEKPFYVGAFGGYSFPENPDNVHSLQNGWSAGLKLGWVLPPLSYDRWVSWEFEYWYQNIGVKQTSSLSGAKANVNIFASNMVLRRPTGMIRPYVGIGPSLVYVSTNASPTATTSLGVGDQSATAFGLNLLVGTRVMFHKTLGVFAEYKHNRAINLVFDNAHFSMNTNAVVGGLVWDFDYFSLP